MAIKIIDEPDVHLTADEYARYAQEYQQAFMFYAGTPPGFERWVRSRKEIEGMRNIFETGSASNGG